MATARLGNYSFRIDPSQVQYSYQIDFATIDTIGGTVVQVLGATTGDITISGTFGQDHAGKRSSWEIAESFHANIKRMMDAQVVPQQQSAGGPVHQPINFTYNSGNVNWNMKVLIKSISDLDGTGAITHSNGKFSYGYTLTLFLVEDSSLILKKVATDAFISRVASGVGWKANQFSGTGDISDAIAFIQAHSTDGTYQGYLANLLQGGAQ